MMASREYVRDVGGDGRDEFKGRRKRLYVRIRCRTDGNQNNIDEAATASAGTRQARGMKNKKATHRAWPQTAGKGGSAQVVSPLPRAGEGLGERE
ncbi:hypothetical protein A9975_08095 [Cupriavidus sp. UME77]|nr:hypothetical protein [Cupriavidus sp. UME77]